MTKFPNAIVITGGIASGKSTFAGMLKERGYAVIDADTISHDQLEICADAVIAEFGSEILANFSSDNATKINRKKLGAIVFNDKKKLKWLEDLLHPRINNEIYRQCKLLEVQAKPYFVDIPLYFEGLARREFTRVAVVYAPKNLLIKRLINRNGLNLHDAMRRVELQLDIEKKREMADFVIDNSKDLANLRHETDLFLERIDKITHPRLT